jgi:DNA-binding MarR family transcriptional regulator
MHSASVWAASVMTGLDALSKGLPGGYNLRDMEALSLVHSQPRCSIDWLQGRIDLSQSGTVRLVDRLEVLGVLRRVRSGGRTVELSTTPAGTRLVKKWYATVESAMTETLGSLDDSDREALVALLARALGGVERDALMAQRTCRTCQWDRCSPTCPVEESMAAPC